MAANNILKISNRPWIVYHYVLESSRKYIYEVDTIHNLLYSTVILAVDRYSTGNENTKWRLARTAGLRRLLNSTSLVLKIINLF
jgi:hypothetical protein